MKDYAFTPPSRPQAVVRDHGVLLAILAFAAYIAALAIVGELERTDPAPAATEARP